MSLNITPIKTVAVDDPRTSVHGREFAILKSAKENTFQVITTTNVSTSSITYNIKVPSVNTFVNKTIYQRVPVRIVLNAQVGNVNPNPLLRPNYFAPRAFPLTQSMSNLQVNFAGKSSSLEIGDMFSALCRYTFDSELKNHEMSITPSYLDTSSNYEDLIGSIKSPLSGYSDASDDETGGRGGFPEFNVVLNTANQAIIDFIFTEPLFISPLAWNKYTPALYGLQNMDVIASFYTTAASRMVSIAYSGALAGAQIASSAIAFNNFESLGGGTFSYGLASPQLLVEFLTPSAIQVIPDSLSYPYQRLQRYPTDFLITMEPNVTKLLTSNNISFNSIPESVYIFIRNNNQVMQSSPNYTDSFARIDQVQINFNNRSGLFSQCSRQQLYSIARNNNCNLNWNEWGGIMNQASSFTQKFGGIGSVLKLNFGPDIGLAESECAGLSGNFQFQCTVLATNINQVMTMTPTLYVISVESGVCTILGGTCDFDIGIVSVNDILSSQTEGHARASYYDVYGSVGGGNFFSSLKDFGHNLYEKIRKGYEKVKPYVSKALEYAPYVAPLLGLGARKKVIRNRAVKQMRRGYGGGELEPYENYDNEEEQDDIYDDVDEYNDNDNGGRMMTNKEIRNKLEKRLR